ncbi:hypothetical protein [Clostridium paraputrificum]|uniref:hypothetical protein n=1 Tax=Clostridium paraputrificum TaxID=29363 RepID=UPI0034A4741B
MKKLSKKNKIRIGVSTIVIILLGIITMIYFNINSEIDSFSKYIEDYKVRTEQYILGENEEKYNEMIEKSRQVIENKNKEDIDELKAGLEKLESEVIENNTNNLKEKIKNIKTIPLEEKNKKEVEEKISEINNLIEKKEFKEANRKVDDLKNVVDGIVEEKRQEKINGLFSEINTFINKKDYISAKEKIKLLESEDLSIEQEKKLKSLNDIVKTGIEESTKKEISLDEAIQLVMKADGKEITTAGLKYSENYDGTEVAEQATKMWNIKKEDYYFIAFEGETFSGYLVGKQSGDVYSLGSEGCSPAYLIKDNKVIKKYDYLLPIV